MAFASTEHWLAQHLAFIASEGKVADWKSAEAALANDKNEVDEIDVLVNNAGITRDGVFRKTLKENWNDVIATDHGEVSPGYLETDMVRAVKAPAGSYEMRRGVRHDAFR